MIRLLNRVFLPTFAITVFLAPLAAPSSPTTIRYRLPTDVISPLQDAALFDAASVRGHDELGRWRVTTTRHPQRDLRTLKDLGAEISIEPRWSTATLPSSTSAKCPIKTPAYDARQGYAKALKIEAAWAEEGGRGQGVQVADVEGEWNFAHEDLPGDRATHVAGRRMGEAGWRAHGTAVLGVVAAQDNGIGMVGLVPEVDHLFTASLGRIGAATALYEVAQRLNPGDVLIVELHGPGPNWDGRSQRGFVPMEFWQPEFEVIKWATDNGIIVVEAGGNGSEDLDAKVYKRKFDRTLRDSGAILIGAGAPPKFTQKERSRLGFSNYGSRVDVQGWGRLVATLDYGDLQGCGDPSRKYTATFAGTSSASPVVAGAIAAIQGVHLKKQGSPLSPTDMRRLLVETGAPQTGSVGRPKRQHIGPLPDVAAALHTLFRN